MAFEVQARHQGLQALRGIAALLVFVHHLSWSAKPITAGNTIWAPLTLGGLGVGVFFVLSGYLMTHKTRDDWWDFAVKRARRIFPGFWIAFLLAAAIHYHIQGQFRFDWGALILWPEGRGHSHYVPYWTLFYEMFFYGVVAFALATSKRPVATVLALLVLSYALAMRPAVWADIEFPDWEHLLLNVFTAYFIGGVILGQLPKAKTPIAGVILAALGATVYWWPIINAQFGNPLPGFHYPDFPYLRQAIGCTILVAAALTWPAHDYVGRFFARAGDASYGIYLIHVAFGTLIAYHLSGFDFSGWPYHAVLALIGVLSLIPSWVFGYYEYRLHNSLRHFSPALLLANLRLRRLES